MPLTFNEREERFIEYLTSLDREQVIDLKCERLGRVADLRKKLMALLNQIIEERAESLAAAMIERAAPERLRLQSDEHREAAKQGNGWHRGRPFGAE